MERADDRAAGNPSITVAGKVIDKDGGTGITGVNVMIKGTATGTTTDLKGTMDQAKFQGSN